MPGGVPDTHSGPLIAQGKGHTLPKPVLQRKPCPLFMACKPLHWRFIPHTVGTIGCPSAGVDEAGMLGRGERVVKGQAE